MRHGWILATASWLALGAAAPAIAAGDPSPTAGADVQEVIVTGTRASDHTALTSAAPVAVISNQSLQATGYTDLGRALEFAVPSLNYARPQTTPSSADTRPFTLRGLSPDEVLVLVNGKRWHTSAVINTNFSVGRGSAPFDISTIPASAIDHIEILSDGAAAQYGSDAIAGVINIILKSNASGGLAAAQAGVTERGDGANVDLSDSQGFSLGNGGRLTLSAEASYAGETNRAGFDQRFGAVDFQIGAPQIQNTDVAASGMLPVKALSGELYDDLLASRKEAVNAEPFQSPGVSPIYPKGFLPKVNPTLWDVGDTLGLRGELPGKVRFDLSNTFGLSNADFHVFNTANVALGLGSPTAFDGGSVQTTEDVLGLTFRRATPELLAGGNVAAGFEYRHDSYRITPGSPDSITGTGAQTFPGYNPRIPVDNGRDAEAAFLDTELKPVRWLSLGGAVRYDHYSDFGGAVTWKATARAEASSWLAFRGSASSGFRAPSLQQEYFSSIQTLANGPNKSLVNVGAFQVSDPVAQALGARPLQAERSHDETLGVVVSPGGGFQLTADIFRTDIDNRIALSDPVSGASVLATLAANGITNVQQAAFFVNALNTRTQGVDVSAKYAGRIDDATSYQVSVSYDRSPTSVRGLAPNPVLGSPSFIGTHARLILTEAQPRDKIVSEFNLSHGLLTGSVHVTRYGSYVDAPILDPQTFTPKTVVDLSVTARLPHNLAATVGVLNVGAAYPDQMNEQALAFSAYGGSYRYGEESPFGVDGRAYYARLTAAF